MSESSPLFLPLIVTAGIVGFALFWSAIVIFIGWASGWRRLANDFEATRDPSGTTYGWQSMRFGIATNYSRTLNITPTYDGVHLQPVLPYRMGHKPLLIPWEYITLGQPQGAGFIQWLSAEIAPKYGGSSVNVTFYGKRVIAALQQYANSG